MENSAFDSSDTLVDFDEISSIVPSIWTFGHEQFWFERAWKILEKQQMTSYSNFIEKGKVFIRATTLAMIYLDFCQKACEEKFYYDDLFETFKTDFICEEDEFGLDAFGFLYARLSEEKFYPGFEKAICELTDNERQNILKILQTEMSLGEIAVGMYCTVKADGIYYTAFIEENEEVIVLLDTTSYETYWKSIEKNFHEIVDEYLDNLNPAYEWLDNGAERISD